MKDIKVALPTTKILLGSCLDTLKGIPDRSVQCCVTSPPYFGLRDYGTGTWEGGVEGCEHSVGGQVQDNKAPGAIVSGIRPGVDASRCRKCGANRIDSQIGIEQTPEAYVENLVEVFREVKRVLRDDGVFWLNLGDSYSRGDRGALGLQNGLVSSKDDDKKYLHDSVAGRMGDHPIIKPKDLIGIPWMVAFALRADGWHLRQDIIWSKPACMPESVLDRCTRSHEYIFMFTKKAHYFYDSEAIKEPAVGGLKTGEPVISDSRKELRSDIESRHRSKIAGGQSLCAEPSSTRNKRSVWTVNTTPYKGAHFATFPVKLIEPMILAGTSEKGCCPTCGSPWERVVDHPGNPEGILGYKGVPNVAGTVGGAGGIPDLHAPNQVRLKPGHTATQYSKATSTGEWVPTCKCSKHEPIPCTVLDPFSGSGTTLAVSLRLGRSGVGCELNPDYVKLAEERILRARGGVPDPWDTDQEEIEAPESFDSMEDLFGL